MCDIMYTKAYIQAQCADVRARSNFGEGRSVVYYDERKDNSCREKEQKNTGSKHIKSTFNRLEQLGLAEFAVAPVETGGS